MSLVCYLTRRACSQFIAQELPLPKGSRIESHVANCAGCREYVRELSSLTMDLDRHLSIPVPEMRFIEPIWERVKPSPRPARWSGLSLAGAAVCGLACGWFAWRLATLPRTQPSENRIAGVTGSLPDPDRPKGPQFSPVPDLPPTRDPTKMVELSPTPVRHFWPRARRTHDPVYTALRSRAAKHQLQEDVASSNRWRDSGRLLEAQGDPGLANVAYQAEYQEHPSDESAFDVGRSAEESGDMEQAMNVYAGLLEAADAKSRPQKGWNP